MYFVNHDSTHSLQRGYCQSNFDVVFSTSESYFHKHYNNVTMMSQTSGKKAKNIIQKWKM